MKNLKKLNASEIKKINEMFTYNNLKGKTKEREQISNNYERTEVSFIANNFDCVQKIMTGNCRNSYKYFAPIGFKDYLENFIK